VRDTPRGLEVLMLRRAERDGDFRSGAAVFPGGAVDAQDRSAHALCVGPDAKPWTDAEASALLELAAGGLDYAVAAVRECYEEVGVLFARDAQGAAASLAADAPERDALQTGASSLAAVFEPRGWTLDFSHWAYLSHWLTPLGRPKRFDTYFFIARAPEGQVAVADQGEAVEVMWLTPVEALSKERGLVLLPVTERTLKDLARHATVDAALQAAREQPRRPLLMPRIGLTARGPRIVAPGDPGWAELGQVDPAGQISGHADIQPGRVVRLTPRVWRVTAPNAGAMTGPGTNTYLVMDPADPARGCTVIDPGPESADHLQAIVAAAPAPIVRILVTHTHRDHSPGARALAAATGAPVLGRLADHPEWQDPHFEPTQALQGGERLALGPTTHLSVVHTPGHTSNHLCYQLDEEALLFTGDHVMQGSTVVINPPDGDMAAYLRSLNELLQQPLDWLAPGHGFLVAQPHDVIRALIAHRLGREEKVVAALRAQATSTLDELLAVVYADTPVQLHPVARRSLLAHLLKLQGEGAARQLSGQPDTWAL
jgi:glyoxylase-like metal-dependent hydrolase (beta-lactamase superfamily II)/8-oxo-dGTP pyrophosphatase MutT (NUDIX family)